MDKQTKAPLGASPIDQFIKATWEAELTRRANPPRGVNPTGSGENLSLPPDRASGETQKPEARFMDMLREYFRKMLKGEEKPREGYTHCMEIIHLMKDGLGEFLIRTEETHYTSDGLLTRIKFADGKIYEVSVREHRPRGD